MEKWAGPITIANWIRDAVFGRTRYNGALPDVDTPEYSDPNLFEPTQISDAQVVSARIEGTEDFRLLIDLNETHQYIESNNGRGHLIVDVRMSRKEHDLMMEMLTEVGVVDDSFSEMAQSRADGASLRLPWVNGAEGDKSWDQQKFSGLKSKSKVIGSTYCPVVPVFGTTSGNSVSTVTYSISDQEVINMIWDGTLTNFSIDNEP